MDIPAAKKEFRVRMLRKREALSREVCEAKSDQISERLFTSPVFRAADTIHFYLATQFEVQTDRMIDETLRLKKRVVIPIIHEKDRTLTLSAWVDRTYLQPGPFGILTLPLSLQKKVDPQAVNVWVLPGVAFDLECNRLGLGGGYYDRLLATTKGVIIGLGFDVQVVNRLPIGERDIPLDQILTETRTISCRRAKNAS